MDTAKRRVERLRVRLLHLSRRNKQLLTGGIDVIAHVGTFYLVYALCFAQMPTITESLLAFIATVALSIPVLIRIGYYRAVIRFVNVDVAIVAFYGVLAPVASFVTIISLRIDWASSLRAGIVAFFILLTWLTGSRFIARLFMNRRIRNREPVLIYGAGQGGVRLAASLMNASKFLPVAFIDDHASLMKTRVQGLEVRDSANLNSLLAETGAKRILLAIPSATREERKRVLDKLEPLAVRVQTIPDVGDLISGEARVDDIRDVAVEDLLGRDIVPPRAELLEKENQGKVVLVTGAGGSIGSELCRQIMSLQPRKLLLFERSEIALYRVQQELEKLASEQSRPIDVVGFLGCVTDQPRVEEIMRTLKVDTVYHAAAYKHVPIVEQNVFEGVVNNVFGTQAVANAAVATSVKRFVLISTDKAVSPTNVMGASKRLSEMVLQGLASQQQKTVFCMVRFGNVLASSGSVVPLFTEQIRAGGPVTVTHPSITRYFMTIPEAAQLVIQAGALARGGDVFVLDMGEPVKIVDLAQKMIHLMGHEVQSAQSPDGDIKIVFSGLRPAEKLYEELLIGSNVTGTLHSRIMKANEGFLPFERLNEVLDEIRHIRLNRDWKGLVALLHEVVEGYQPTGGIEDHLFKAGLEPGSSPKVTDLETYRNV